MKNPNSHNWKSECYTLKHHVKGNNGSICLNKYALHAKPLVSSLLNMHHIHFNMIFFFCVCAICVALSGAFLCFFVLISISILLLCCVIASPVFFYGFSLVFLHRLSCVMPMAYSINLYCDLCRLVLNKGYNIYRIVLWQIHFLFDFFGVFLFFCRINKVCSWLHLLKQCQILYKYSLVKISIFLFYQSRVYPWGIRKCRIFDDATRN